jgi:hypothetical protein
MASSWDSILRALHHPSYVAPSLKETLVSRLPILKDCTSAYRVAVLECVLPPDSITLDGVTFDVSAQQKDLTKKFAEKMFLDTTEAFKIVCQQGRIGVVDLDGLANAYMKERTAILRVVKSLYKLAAHCDNPKMGDIAKEVLSKIGDDALFLVNLVEGIKTRVERQLPQKAVSDPGYSLLWSSQVCHSVFMLMADTGGGV